MCDLWSVPSDPHLGSNKLNVFDTREDAVDELCCSEVGFSLTAMRVRGLLARASDDG